MSTSGLARRLSRPVLLFYGIGTILGAGIYVLIGEVAGEARSIKEHVHRRGPQSSQPW